MMTVNNKVEIVRELSDFAGDACLVKYNDSHYIVSSAMAYSGFETLIFPANEKGEVTDWREVGGGRGIDRAEAIAMFEETGPYRGWTDKDDK
jgi:hypothetical protein